MNRKFEASTIEDACINASKELGCSVDKLDYKIIQYPSKGILGFFPKQAIIEVVLNAKTDKKENIINSENIKNSIEKKKSEDTLEIVKEAETSNNTLKTKKERPKTNAETEIVNSFFSEKTKPKYVNKIEDISALELEKKIKALFATSCFEIDTVEVDIEDKTAFVFIDGDDAALLIGKEGYRYNALSYLLFNWINSKYGLYLKLEIAQFLASQQDMIKHQTLSLINMSQLNAIEMAKDI